MASYDVILNQWKWSARCISKSACHSQLSCVSYVIVAAISQFVPERPKQFRRLPVGFNIEIGPVDDECA
jgi:hypothetical protein